MTSDRPTPSGGGRARGLALLVATFLAGGLGGVAADRLILPRGEPGVSGRGVLLRKEPDRDGIPERIRQLHLTPDQETRIRAISTRWQSRADSILSAMLPRVRDIEHGMFQEMMCVLTPAQDSAYLAWRVRLGLNQEEGREQLSRVTAGTCPVDTTGVK
jgi:hypothetical protein